MKNNSVVIKSDFGSFLFDSDKLKVYLNDKCDKPLLSGKSDRKIAKDYAKATINVVQGCNLSCQYCPYGVGAKSENIQYMPKETGRAIIDFLAKLFPASVKLVKISFTSNGEPVLNIKTINAIRDYANELSQGNPGIPKFKFNFATNGTLISRSELQQYIRNPDQEIFFSIDGYPELHDQIRTICGGRSTYQVIESKILYYKQEAKIFNKNLTSSTVLTAINDNYDLILIHLAKMGFDSIVTRPIRGSNDTQLGLNPKSIDTFIRGYDRFIKLIEQDALYADGKYISMVCNRYDFFGRLFTALILGEKRQQGCPGCPPNYDDITKYSLVFDINGDVYFPCRDFIGMPEYLLGNINTEIHFSKVYEIMNPLRTEERPSCSRCWAFSLCGGGCYNAAFLSTGQIHEPDHNLCKIILFVAERAVRLVHDLAIINPELLAHLKEQAMASSPWYKATW